MSAESQRIWLAVLLMALTVLLTVSIGRDITSRRDLNDDDLDFYYNALQLDYPQQFDHINAQVSAQLAQEPLNRNCHCLWEKFRFDLRAQFRNHYLLYNYLIQGVREALMPFTRGAGVDYASSVGVFLITTYYLGFVISLALIGLAVVGIVRFDIAIAFAIAVPVLLLVREYSPILPGFWELRVRPSGFVGWLEWMRSALFLFISPSSTFIGYFPRGLSMFLMLAVFMLRWSGFYGLAYASLAIIAGLHQGTGGLTLFTLLMIDAVLFPRRFRSISTLVGIAVAFVPFAIPHAIMGDLTGISWWTIPALVAVIAGVLVFDGFVKKSRAMPLVLINGLREKLVSLGPIPADMVAIGALWFAWALLSLIMYARIGQPDAIYTWGDLPARYLMAFRGPVFIGIAAIVVAWLSQRVSMTILASFAVGLCLMVAWLFVTPGHYLIDLSRLAKSLDHYEQMLQATQPGKPQKYDEGLMYYAASKSLERNADLVTPVIHSLATK